MSRGARTTFSIKAEYDRETGEFYCVRLVDRPLPREFRDVSARSLEALRSKLARIIREEFFEPDAEIELVATKA